ADEIIHRGSLQRPERLERPVALPRLDVDALLGGGRGALPAGIGRAALHPRLEVRDHLGRELALRRHLELLVLVADRLDEEALVEVARDDGRAGLAALEQALARVDVELALQLLRLRAVAGVAAVD